MKASITMQSKKLKKTFEKLIAIIFWVMVWFFIALLVNNKLLVPTPFDTIKTLFTLIPTASFYKIIFITFLRVIIGLLIGIILGYLLAILAYFVYYFKVIFEPFVTLVKATPVALIIVLLVLIINRDFIPSIVSFLTILPIIYKNVKAGLDSVDNKLLEMANVYKVSFNKKLKALYIPSVKPYFISSLESSLGMGWKSAIAAEVIVYPLVSIGRELYNSNANLDTSLTFAWGLVIIILSILLDALVKLIFNKIKEKKNDKIR